MSNVTRLPKCPEGSTQAHDAHSELDAALRQSRAVVQLFLELTAFTDCAEVHAESIGVETLNDALWLVRDRMDRAIDLSAKLRDGK